MAIAIKSSRGKRAETPNNRGLTPSDQLLGIFVVNFIITVWVAVAFTFWYDSFPHLPTWIYIAEASILVASFVLANFDTLFAKLWDLLRGGDGKPATVNANETVLKVAVFALTLLYIFVLWRIGEETGGVISPFAPFVTAPALFAPFVTKNGKTIIALSILVTIAIVFSEKTSTLELESLWPYKGTAAVMVLLAGVLTALRMQVAKQGGPLTGEGSERERPDLPAGNGKPA